MGTKPIFNVKMGLKGRFVFDVIHHADGTVDHYEMDNLITNSGLDLIGTGGAGGVGEQLIGGIAVGTGNTAVTPSDTTLAAGIGVTHNRTGYTISVISSTAPYVVQETFTFTFAVGAVVGNVAEMAAVPASSSATGPVLSRALTQVDGSPAVIPTLSTDQLIVTYQFQTIMNADITGTLNVDTDGSPTTVGYTIKPIGLAGSAISYSKAKISDNSGSGTGWTSGISSAAAFKSVTDNPGVPTPYVHWGTVTEETYVSGSYSKTITYNIGSANAINFQFATWAFNYYFAFQMLLASPVTLTADQSLSWPVTVSWAAA